MSRRRWKSVAVAASLAGGTFLVTGSAAFADPVEPYRLQLRLAVDCPKGEGGAGEAGPAGAGELAVRR